MPQHSDLITPEAARTLDGLFATRVQHTPDAIAYQNFDEASGQWNQYTWLETEALVARWQAALAAENLEPGDRVAIMMRNSIWWVIFDQDTATAAIAC